MNIVGNISKSSLDSKVNKIMLKCTIMPRNLKVMISLDPDNKITDVYNEIEKNLKSFQINFKPVRIELDEYVIPPYSSVQDNLENNYLIVAYSAENVNPLNYKKKTANKSDEDDEILKHKRDRENTDKSLIDKSQSKTKKRNRSTPKQNKEKNGTINKNMEKPVQGELSSQETLDEIDKIPNKKNKKEVESNKPSQNLESGKNDKKKHEKSKNYDKTDKINKNEDGEKNGLSENKKNIDPKLKNKIETLSKKVDDSLEEVTDLLNKKIKNKMKQVDISTK